MTAYNPSDLPTLEQVFGTGRLKNVFTNIRITSVAPVMVLTDIELRCLPGVGKQTVRMINQALEACSLPHRSFNDRLEDFVDEAFGGIEGAPVSVLSVTSIEGAVCRRCQYAPLRTLGTIEAAFPGMTLGTLMSYTPKRLLEELSMYEAFGPNANAMQYEIREINRRIERLNPQLELGSTRLRAVD